MQCHRESRHGDETAALSALTLAQNRIAGRVTERRRTADLPSAAMSIGSVLAVIFGLKAIAQDGLPLSAVLVILAGVGLGVLFARRQLPPDDPLIDLRLFGKPAFSASVATYYGLSLALAAFVWARLRGVSAGASG